MTNVLAVLRRTLKAVTSHLKASKSPVTDRPHGVAHNAWWDGTSWQEPPNNHRR